MGEKHAIYECATKGVSSQLLFLLHSLGPLKPRNLQQILHPTSTGSGQIPKKIAELENLQLIETKKLKIRPFQKISIEESKWENDTVYLRKPIYSEKETGIILRVPTFKWIESPYQISLNEKQKKFLINAFARLSTQGSFTKTNFPEQKDINLYEIVNQIIIEELTIFNIGNLLFDGNYLNAKQKFMELTKSHPKNVMKNIEQISKEYKIKSTIRNRIWLLATLIRNSEITQNDLRNLAKPFVEFGNSKNSNNTKPLINDMYLALKED